MEQSTVSVGTVPIYEAAVETVAPGEIHRQMDPELLFRVIEGQAEEGVDFVTVHCGVTISSVERLKRQGRIMDVVSRGGRVPPRMDDRTESREPALRRSSTGCSRSAKKYDMTLQPRRRHPAGLPCRCHATGRRSRS